MVTGFQMVIGGTGWENGYENHPIRMKPHHAECGSIGKYLGSCFELVCTRTTACQVIFVRLDDLFAFLTQVFEV
jgi:hypothetical protein